MRFFLLGLVFLGFSVILAVRQPLPLWAATSDTEVILDECQKRTGLSESGCIEFVKKYMNVERCQQYTSFSAQECEQKITAIREDTRFQSDTKKGSSTPEKAPEKVDPSRLPSLSRVVPTTLRGRVLEARREKEQRFSLIIDETKAVIEYLKRQGKDTTSLEAALAEFDVKKQATLLAYDRYQSLAEALHSDDTSALDGPRQTVLQVLYDATGYYRQNMLPVLLQAVSGENQL